MELLGQSNGTLVDQGVIAKAQGILHKNPGFWLLLKNHSGNSEPHFPRGGSQLELTSSKRLPA